MFGLMQTPAMLSFYIGLSNTACLILISFSGVDIQLATPMKGCISTHNSLLTLYRALEFTKRFHICSSQTQLSYVATIISSILQMGKFEFKDMKGTSKVT